MDCTEIDASTFHIFYVSKFKEWETGVIYYQIGLQRKRAKAFCNNACKQAYNRNVMDDKLLI